MIVVDASAIVAVLAGEPEREAFLKVLTERPAVMSPVGYWEAAIAASRALGDEGTAGLDDLLAALNIEVRPASAETARAAVVAEIHYGKRTAARLNLGDCFAYALAKELNAPLLYKGADFPETDITSAV